MDIFASLWPALILLLVLVAIVAALVAWRRREGLEAEEDRGIGTVRRLYFYFGTFVYMIVASVGVVLILRYVLDELFGPARLNGDVTVLALGVVLAMIWTPVWLWHRVRVQRYLLALQDREYRVAYGYLSEETQALCALDDFLRYAAYRDVRDARMTLEDTQRFDSTAVVTAEVTVFDLEPPFNPYEYSYTQAFDLRLENGQWRLVSPEYWCPPYSKR